MAIKDKDGSVLKIRGPNPLVQNMEDWDASAIKLLNANWQSKTIVDENNEFVEPRDIGLELGLFEGSENSKTISPVSFIQEIQEVPAPVIASTPVEVIVPTPIEVIVPTPIEMPSNINLHVDDKVAKILKERSVDYYCAPVIGFNNFVDDLYGSSYKTLKYGEQFVFSAVIIDQSDLQLQFWSVKNLEKGSIIYKKVKRGGERWWQISSTEEKTGGYIHTCITSELNPDFS